MLSLPARTSVYVCTGPVDFRKQHDGLVAIVRNHLGTDPLDGSLFAFFNKRRDRVKLLLWDANGFWLMYKRLEAGTFEKLVSSGQASLRITRAQLSMLLDGFEVISSKKRREFAEEVFIGKRSTRDDETGNARHHKPA